MRAVHRCNSWFDITFGTPKLSETDKALKRLDCLSLCQIWKSDTLKIVTIIHYLCHKWEFGALLDRKARNTHIISKYISS